MARGPPLRRSAGRRTRCSGALAQGHTAIANALEATVDAAALDPGRDYRAAARARQPVAALAPPNFPLTNPAAIKAIIDTGGASMTRGARRLAADMRHPPRLPARSDPCEFELGKDLAATPGTVVLRTAGHGADPVRAHTPEVHAEPLLVVPSLVNKYYLTDLSPGRSLVEHLVGGGYEVFHMSWLNPGPEQRDFDLDTYIAAISRRSTTSRAITGERRHALGVCAGGQLLTIAMAHSPRAASRTAWRASRCRSAVLDHDEPASPTGLLNREAAERRWPDRAGGLVDGRELSNRSPGCGRSTASGGRGCSATCSPPTSRRWTSSTGPRTRRTCPRGLVRDLLELTLENKLTKPEALTGSRPRSISRHQDRRT